MNISVMSMVSMMTEWWAVTNHVRRYTTTTMMRLFMMMMMLYNYRRRLLISRLHMESWRWRRRVVDCSVWLTMMVMSYSVVATLTGVDKCRRTHKGQYHNLGKKNRLRYYGRLITDMFSVIQVWPLFYSMSTKPRISWAETIGINKFFISSVIPL